LDGRPDLSLPRAAFRRRQATYTMALPFGETTGARDARALSILAKTIYRELRSSGFEARDVVALANELLGQVTSDLRSDAPSPNGPRRG
jgi:hypothetical protein